MKHQQRNRMFRVVERGDIASAVANSTLHSKLKYWKSYYKFPNYQLNCCQLIRKSLACTVAIVPILSDMS